MFGGAAGKTPGAVAPPTVTGVSPSTGSAAGGTAITITGTNFAGLPSVTIGGAPCSSIIVVDSTTITAVTPAGTTGARDLVVTTSGGTFTLSSAFTYTAITAPTISSVAPNFGSSAGGTAITITGTNFTGTMSVTIGGASCTSIVLVSGTSITAVTPAGTFGARDVVVSNVNGFATLTGGFTYSATAPLAGDIILDPSILANMWQEITGTSGTPVAVNGPVGSMLNTGTIGGIFRAPSTGARPTLRNSGSLYWLEVGTSTIFTLGFATQTPANIWWAGGYQITGGNTYGGLGGWTTGTSNDYDSASHVTGTREATSLNICNTRGNVVRAVTTFGALNADFVASFESTPSLATSRKDFDTAASAGVSYGNHSVNNYYAQNRPDSSPIAGRIYGQVGYFSSPSTAIKNQNIVRLAARQGRTLTPP